MNGNVKRTAKTPSLVILASFVIVVAGMKAASSILVPFFLTYCMFVLIYRIVPDKKVHFTSALQAALFTGLLWELAKHLFSWYGVHLAEYSFFYGSLSTLVIFILWVYYSSTILVVGGEFAYFLEEDRQRSTV